jgi:protein-disulfide isomerase
MQEMVRLGSQATPTAVIDGEIIIGFDLKRISASLRL